MIQPRIRRLRPGRGALALVASAVLVGGLVAGFGSYGAAHAQTGQASPTASSGPPPPPPPPAAASPTRAATQAPPAPPAPPAAASPTRAAATPTRAATPAAQAPAAAPAAQKPVAAAPVARPALPNTGTGGSGQSGSGPLVPLAAAVGGLLLLGSSLVLRLRSRKG